jgi:hypothetical protein
MRSVGKLLWRAGRVGKRDVFQQGRSDQSITFEIEYVWAEKDEMGR